MSDNSSTCDCRSDVCSSDLSGTWTATYTIVAGSLDATNRNVSLTATDDAGNANPPTFDSTNATVDAQAPVVTDGKLGLSGEPETGVDFVLGYPVANT